MELAILDTVRQRSQYLEVLKEQPLTKRDIVDETDVSRSTVNRSIRELEQAKLVTSETEGYEITTTGILVLNEYKEFRNKIEKLEKAHSILNEIPKDKSEEFNLNRKSEVILSKAHYPNKPTNEFINHLEGPKSIKTILPVFIPRLIDELFNFSEKARTRIDLMTSNLVLNNLRDTYIKSLRDSLSTSNMTLYHLENTPKYGVFIYEMKGEEYTAILKYSQKGIEAILTSHDNQIVDWAKDCYSDYKEKATQLTVKEI